MAAIDLSVVIPVYNAAARLPAVLDRLRSVLNGLGAAYEIVLVDDGSRDASFKVLREQHARDPRHLVAIQLMRNYGQHNALMAGFRRTRGRFIITMDDDLQHPPEEIPKLLEAIRASELDLVYGVPMDRKHRAWRNLGSTLIIAFYRLVFRTKVTPSSFRVIRRELLESIFSYSLNFTFIDGLLAWNTQRVGEIPVTHHARADGRSGYSFTKLLLLALNLFTNFSLLPLQFVSILGFLTAAVGLFLAAHYTIQALRQQQNWPGYASTIVAVLTLGGAQLMAIGIMGEYLGRLHLNVNRKPQYVEREALTSDDRS